MALLKRLSRPFAGVRVEAAAPGGERRVRAVVSLPVVRGGARTGLALDASGSMEPHYADPTGRGSAMAPAARALCEQLACVSEGGDTAVLFWALGSDGSGTSFVGDLTPTLAAAHPFTRPARLGGGTQLLPALNYFVERFADAPWGLYVFLADGAASDLPGVKEYSRALAAAVRAGTRPPLKLAVVGVGAGVSEPQMEELDGLFVGTGLPDLWCHAVAADLSGVPDALSRVVAAHARVAAAGRVTAPDGTVLADYAGGVPGVVEFVVPPGASYFTLTADGRAYHQALSDADGAGVPAADPPPGEPPAIAGVAPGTRFLKEVPAVPGAAESGGRTGRRSASRPIGPDVGSGGPGTSGTGHDGATVSEDGE